ncbi:MAG: ankyrin repeat domain-containing protein [Alphaproteobacteria bacterium]|nr:ankyrin repeat domain-containing protein [Alphaproteobacteria bacterium]
MIFKIRTYIFILITLSYIHTSTFADRTKLISDEENQYYRIVSVHTNRALDSRDHKVNWVGKYDKRHLNHQDLDHQLWTFKPVGNHYQIISVYTKKVLDIGSKKDNKVAKVECNKTLDGQLWSLEEVENENCLITSKSNNKALDSWGSEVNWVGKYDKHMPTHPHYRHQLWKIEPVFHEAVYEGNIRMMRSLRERHQSSTAQDRRGETPIHIAAEKGNVEAINILTINQRDLPRVLSIRNRQGYTPYHVAVVNRNKRALLRLAELYKSGINQPVINPMSMFAGCTPLHLSQNQGSDDITKFLLKEESSLLKVSALHVGTPLHIAARQGQGRIMELFNFLKNYALNSARDRYPYRSSRERISRQTSGLNVDYYLDYVDYSSGVPDANIPYRVSYIKSLLSHFMMALGVNDQSGKKPLDYIRLQPQLHNGKQVLGSSEITSQNWQVSLFFKKNSLCAIPLLHANIAFERLADLSEIQDLGGEVMNDLHINDLRINDLRIVHLMSEKENPLNCLYGAGEVDIIERDRANKYIRSRKNPPTNIFKWSIDARLAAEVWNEISAQKGQKRRFSFLPGLSGGEHCTTFALQILEKCGIRISKLVRNYHFGVVPEELIKALEDSH